MASIHVKTAFQNIRRSPFQAAAAVFVLTITFFIVTVLSVLVYSSDKVIQYFETRPQVIAFLKDDADPSSINKLQEKLLNDNRVKEVNYVSKEKALAIYKEATEDNPLLSELVNPSIFPASLEFSLSDLGFAEQVIDEMKGNEVVDQVGFTATLGDESTLNDTVVRLRTITSYVRLGGGIFVGVLMATSFVVLIVVMSMRLVSRKGEIEILDLIGATSGFIRSPIILESLIYSMTGVFLGWILGFILVLYTTPSIVGYFSEIRVLPRNITDLLVLFGLVFAGEFVLGLFLAISGSLLAVKRSKKSK